MPGPKILWLARHLPVPLNAGDRIYTARLVEALARAGCKVRYLGLANPEMPTLGAEALDSTVDWDIVPGKPYGLIRGMLSSRPMAGARFGTRLFERRLLALLADTRYDAIVVDHYGLGWTIPIVLAHSSGVRPAIVHIAHDFETDVTAQIARGYRGNPVRKAALRLNARRTAQAEQLIAANSDLVVTLTENDANQFRAIGAGGESLVLPPGYDGERIPHREITDRTPRQLAVVGSYRWTAKQLNLTAFLEAADARFAEAGIRLLVIGDAPEEYRRRWEGRLVATKFLGFVDDLSLCLNQCRMGLVIEAIGGGFKLKVLDYVMRRAPVAALSPALGGQSPAITEHFLNQETATALVDQILHTVDDIQALNAMQDAAYSAAAALYNWDANGAALRDAINRAVANCRSRTSNS